MILHRLLQLTMRAKIMIKLIALIIGFLMVIFEVSVEYYAEPDKEVKPKNKIPITNLRLGINVIC